MNIIEQQVQELRQQMMLAGANTHTQEQLAGAPGWRGLVEAGEARVLAAGGPWALSISGDDATCSDCVYMRGPVTLAPTVAALTLALEDAYIAAHIDLADGTAELVEGASIGDVTDAAPQDDDTTYKKLLYHVVKTGGVWAVTTDYRNAPQLGVRL